MTSLILDVIDQSICQNRTTYVHCFSGRGRTGVIAGAFAARHGVASGESVLDFLAHRRLEHALFEPSPENEVQRNFVRNWRVGQ
jgi:protein-tyrosine phosphatase